jgi:hypothetical protein
MILTSFDGLNDGFVAVLVCAETSPLRSSQTHFLTNHEVSLSEQKAIFGFVDLANSLFVKQFLNPQSQLARRQDAGELMLIFKRQNGSTWLLSLREKPEPKHDWPRVFLQFIANYANPIPDENKAWRYGQVCQEAGEYMCRDCGYMEEFRVGDVFPVCEVCLSGDPDGPVDTGVGYWEKI